MCKTVRRDTPEEHLLCFKAQTPKLKWRASTGFNTSFQGMLLASLQNGWKEILSLSTSFLHSSVFPSHSMQPATGEFMLHCYDWFSNLFIQLDQISLSLRNCILFISESSFIFFKGFLLRFLKIRSCYLGIYISRKRHITNIKVCLNSVIAG